MAKNKSHKRREVKAQLEVESLKYLGKTDGLWDADVLDVVSLDISGNYTIVHVYTAYEKDAVGIAKYNPNDEKLGYPYSEERGLQIALGRACADIARQVYP